MTAIPMQYEAEIARLQTENDSLRAALAMTEATKVRAVVSTHFDVPNDPHSAEIIVRMLKSGLGPEAAENAVVTLVPPPSA